MTDLADLVESLKREVAVPGTFGASFTSTTDDDLAASLLDAFAQTQLDGFFAAWSANDDGIVTPDLTRGAAALVVLYAGVRFLTTDLLNRKSHVRYEANGAVFEQDQGASVVVEALKALRAKKDALIALAVANARSQIGTVVVDGYFIKAVDFYRNDVIDSVGTGTSPYGWL